MGIIDSGNWYGFLCDYELAGVVGLLESQEQKGRALRSIWEGGMMRVEYTALEVLKAWISLYQSNMGKRDPG